MQIIPNEDAAIADDARLVISVATKKGRHQPWTEASDVTGDLVAAFRLASSISAWEVGLLVGGRIYWTSRSPCDFNSGLIVTRTLESRERRLAEALISVSERIRVFRVTSAVLAEDMEVECYVTPEAAMTHSSGSAGGVWVWVEHVEHAVCFVTRERLASGVFELREIVLDELRRREMPF